jgi:FdhD protein
MTLPVLLDYKVHEYNEGSISETIIPVSCEYRFTININSSAFVSIACSGSELKELAMGLVISEGIIQKMDEILSINIDEENKSINIVTVETDEMLERLFRIHSIVSGCGQGKNSAIETSLHTIKKHPNVKPAIVTQSIKDLLHHSEIHKKTRGVHSVSLYSSEGKEIIFFDEIGRHNAVDKIIGYSLEQNLTFNDTFLAATGRLSSEIVFKASSSSIPLIISKASPTTMAIDIARKYNVALIGKVRAQKFVVFHGHQCIDL